MGNTGHKLYTLKYYLLIYLTFIIGCFSAQKNTTKEIPADSLKKYSYYIGSEVIKLRSDGLMTVMVGNGTGFFIRDKKGLYFVTARHNIVPCENGERLFTKTIFFWLQEESGSPTNKISIEPTQFYQLPCHQKNNDTDVIAIKVIKPISVYSIESFLLNIPTEYDEVEMWGYPENKKDTSASLEYELISNTTLPSGSYSFETKQDSATKEIDWINSYLVSKTSINNNSRSGYSGSPTFMKDKKTGKWVFIGLNWGHGDFGAGDKYLELVRPNIVLSQIESLDDRFTIK